MGETKKRIGTEFLHHANYWLLVTWLVLRILDYIFSFMAISLGFGVEANPIGLNLMLVVVGFSPILGMIIINYKYPRRRDALFFIFFGTSFYVIFQTIFTINPLYAIIFFLSS